MSNIFSPISGHEMHISDLVNTRFLINKPLIRSLFYYNSYITMHALISEFSRLLFRGCGRHGDLMVDTLVSGSGVETLLVAHSTNIEDKQWPDWSPGSYVNLACTFLYRAWAAKIWNHSWAHQTHMELMYFFFVFGLKLACVLQALWMAWENLGLKYTRQASKMGSKRYLIIFVISNRNNWGKRITDSGREKETGRKMGSNRKRQV